ncbi:class I SAM-dependent methyltransferase [Fibrella sp. HMF5335]|uniref:Class I SAM-dependent methyltransferase n=1 Tax=Fibrella rubiginis TaxID=2817060 RepID=A0A939K407_9BACT|nr:class I SAM-dependent methyltransferase [Fibrella rubiginis]MBO0935681.1 class I SAM-dependent methyltransferase [Fibrella rubiginis]
MIAAYLRHLWQARDEHALHSPFVYSLYTQAIRSRAKPAATAQIEALRKALYRSSETIQVTDYGAGSRTRNGTVRSVADIARAAQKSPRYAQLLYRLVRHMQARTVLELGTSLGLTTAYLAQAVAETGGQLISFEGCPSIASLARQHLTQLHCPPVEIVEGNLDQTLASRLVNLTSLDLVFFDANHRYEPTLAYFETALTKAHNDSLFVFDDIHWSADMERAWAAIQAHPATRVTIDLFGVGLVFFRREQPEQHFILQF